MAAEADSTGGESGKKPYDVEPTPAPPREATPPTKDKPAKVVVVREPEALSRLGWLSWQVLTTVGVTTLVTAMILAAVQASRMPKPEESGWAPRSLVAAGRVLLLGPVFAALGVGAVGIASLALKRPFGELRLAGSRMLAGVGVFWLIVALGPLFSDARAVEQVVSWFIGAAAYFLIIWASFRFSRNTAMLIAAIHLALWGVVQLLIWAIPRLASGAESASATGAAPGA